MDRACICIKDIYPSDSYRTSLISPLCIVIVFNQYKSMRITIKAYFIKHKREQLTMNDVFVRNSVLFRIIVGLFIYLSSVIAYPKIN